KRRRTSFMNSVDTKKDAQACTMDYLLPTGVQDSASSQKNNIVITHDNTIFTNSSKEMNK
ncbi:hypothetical protein P4U07_29105, partial [Bacillus mycoides]|uniref:hypothetical protein n=1 Tax=Bacillus mycoides TaxID=1405 RepID=UPI002E1B3790|nr:hypothetical protein [Bacillus mycoides]